ncbi:MAG: PQQ-binding-like beta-propeller repeat protein [Candidatus Bathyarchaeia archaeon]
MEKMKSKTLKATALTLIIAFALLTVSIGSVNAAVIEINTYLYVMLAPNPVGINQTVIVTVQMDKTSPTAMGVKGGDHFKGFMVEITHPDGTVETKGPYEAWATSGFFFAYKPTMEGTYKFQARFPGQWINTTNFATGGYLTNTQYWFRPSTSSIVELTVQHEPIQPFPSVPLPTDYWTRPIYAENKGWWQVTDNWLMQDYDIPLRSFCISTAFAPYTSAPDSPHILWKKPLVFGGIAGGSYGDKSFYTGLSYEQFYLPLIVQGRIIYVDHSPMTASDIIGTRCIDLYTGEEIWFLPNVNIIFAQIFDIENPNEHGLIAHLWEVSGPTTNATARIYDAFTGHYQFTITNITWGGFLSFAGGPTVFGPSGEVLSYRLDNVKHRLILWNSSLAIFKAFPWIGGEVGEIYNPAPGARINGQLGIQWNVSIPTLPGNPSISVVGEGYILAQDRVANRGPGPLKSQFIYIDSAFDAKTGSWLWTRNRTDIYSAYFRRPVVIRDGVYVIMDEAELRIHAYNIKTGEELWVTDPLPSGWNIFTYQLHIAYGKLYTTSYDGHVRAYDIKTGKLAWDFYMGNAGLETVYGSWPTYNGFTIADKKIYVANDEHSPDATMWRGGKLWCIDAENGTLLWSISGWLRNPAIADGYLTALNSLDGQIYTFGKGPSATTVSVSAKTVVKGSRILIEGSVTDLSPGQRGTPAVARESMAAWMEYLHMQKPVPAEVKGVPVELYAIYPDGSYKYIDTTVTNGFYGTFSHAWTPPEEGTYTIIAVFRGDESYGSSSAATGLLVTAAPPEPPTPATAEQAGTLQSIIESQQPLITALIVLVAIAIVIGVVNIVIIIKKMRK